MSFIQVDQKYTRFVFAFFMAGFMSAVMSLLITVSNLGLVHDIAVQWLQAWATSFVLAFPITLTVSPLVHKMVVLFIKAER
ncbi:MAG: DUF2798 domain-containing protein [Pseudomonadales bacterium]|nr:DUF2798 domain-containing protein [Pseudomonadales bacterium]